MIAPIGEHTRLLVQLLRQPLPQPVPQPVPDDLRWPSTAQWDWRAFAAACDEHKVASLVYCRLRELAGVQVPPGLLEHLGTRFYEISARNYHLARKLVELTALLEAARVPVLAYKGSAVAMVAYGDLALREHQDLDLLVREEHLIQAVGVMSRAGFEAQPQGNRPYFVPYLPQPENPKHVAWAEEIVFRAPDRNYFVDLHWRLGHDFWTAFSPDARKVWERSGRVSLPQGSVSTFCQEDLFLALCSHGTKHRWLCLKWLVDVARLLREAETWDWSRVEEMIRIRPGAGVSASLGILLAHELLDAPIPAEAARMLPAGKRVPAAAAAMRDEILLHGQTSGNYYDTLLELEGRPLARMKYRATVVVRAPAGLFREVFVQVSDKDRALTHLPEKLQFLHHLIRPARLVVKHSGRVAAKTWRRLRRGRPRPSGLGA